MSTPSENPIDDVSQEMGDFVSDTHETQFDHSVVTTCSTCGGNMVFNPEKGDLKCVYCGSEKAIEADNSAIIEHCFEDALKDGVRTWNEDDIKTFNCKNCGAQIVVSPNVQAEFCNYCGSSHIVQQEAEKTIPPHYLIPFHVTEKDAGNFFKTWIGKRWLAPNDLKKSYDNNKLLGTYVPHWTFDAQTQSYYTAQRGDYYYVTRTRVVNGKTEMYQERHTRWTPVSGDYNCFYDDVLTSASNKVDTVLMEKVQPFNLGALTGYKAEYLSGFFAERYSIGLEDGWVDSKATIDDRIETGIRRKIGGDEVRFLNVQSAYNDVTFKHILLPIWLSSFNYKEQLYHFMINGQTGEVQGEYPKSALKIAGLVVLGILAAVAIYYFFFSNGSQQY